MSHLKIRQRVACACAAAAALLVLDGRVAGQDQTRFHTGVELINVTATVTDRSGRFVSGLSQSDFLVYEDDQPVQITHFSAERVPVSLGIVLDTSGSMRGSKIEAARAALDRFLTDLLGPDDEFFLFRFENTPHLVEGWTTDRTEDQRRAGTRASGRRHRPLRCDRRGSAATALRTTHQKGASRDLRRQRYQQPHRTGSS